MWQHLNIFQYLLDCEVSETLHTQSSSEKDFKHFHLQHWLPEFHHKCEDSLQYYFPPSPLSINPLRQVCIYSLSSFSYNARVSDDL